MNDIADVAVRFGRIAAILPVSDMTKAQAFYSGVLGFETTFENGNPVGFAIMKRDGAELLLSLQPTHKAATFNVAHMMVGNIDALYAICQQQQVRIIKGLQDKDYGLRSFVLADPDGNRIDVGQAI